MKAEATQGLERFADEIAAILDLDPGAVDPDSRLVADLDFDSLAFAELAVLMMERYASANFLPAISGEIEAEALTVRSVFENYARAPAD